MRRVVGNSLAARVGAKLRVSPLLIIASALLIIASAQPALAGGREFPGNGTRAIGRGGSGFTRADDPTVMLRNPALLADLWDDVALAGVNLSFVDACFRATGAYGWDVRGTEYVQLRDERYLNTTEPSTDLDGDGIETFLGEPYPEVCYEGPMPILPTVAVAKKLAPNLGVGLGFFPPDTAGLAQWGNRDGTVETENGLRPSPTRWFNSHLNVSYFTALAAVGYRPLDWLRIGAGFQWQLVVFEATTWARATPDLNVRDDVRADVFGRDLFIPGFVASVHVVPHDNFDAAIGFKWSDRVRSQGKLDITTSAFGTGEAIEYLDSDGLMRSAVGTIPTTSHNQAGEVSSPPIWVPQLWLGARYASRIKPRATTATWDAAHHGARGGVDDHMATERWDIEANAVMYFNSVYDQSGFVTPKSASARVDVVSVLADGSRGLVPAPVGRCTKTDATGSCIGSRETITRFRGKNQLALRIGGDYNIFPGLFSVRAGFSHETEGQDPSYLNVREYMLSRTGLHAGATLRVAGKTDISIGFAYFIQRDLRLQVNESMTVLPLRYRTEEYNYAEGKHDGVAKLEVPYGERGEVVDGPNFANAGSYFYDLSVLSVTLAQHF